MAILVDGRIPAHTICPWKKQCPMARGSGCKHKGLEAKVPYSCASARGFELCETKTDEQMNWNNEVSK